VGLWPGLVEALGVLGLLPLGVGCLRNRISPAKGFLETALAGKRVQPPVGLNRKRAGNLENGLRSSDCLLQKQKVFGPATASRQHAPPGRGCQARKSCACAAASAPAKQRSRRPDSYSIPAPAMAEQQLLRIRANALQGWRHKTVLGSGWIPAAGPGPGQVVPRPVWLRRSAGQLILAAGRARDGGPPARASRRGDAVAA